MAWPKGKPRPENAGRRKGTPNKETLTIQQLCEKHGVSPIEVLIELCGPEHETEMRFSAAKEVSQYLYPKRRAIEIDANVNMELAKKAEEYAELDKKTQIEIMESEIKRLRG